MIQHLLQQRAGRIGHGHRVADLARHRNHIHCRHHGLRLVDCLQNFVAHAGGDARIHINHPRVRNTRAKLSSKSAAGFRAHVVGKKHGHHLVVRLLSGGIRKPGLGGSLRFQGQHFAVVAHQGDGGVGNLLGERDVFRLADGRGDGAEIDRAGRVQPEPPFIFRILRTEWSSRCREISPDRTAFSIDS